MQCELCREALRLGDEIVVAGKEIFHRECLERQPFYVIYDLVGAELKTLQKDGI